MSEKANYSTRISKNHTVSLFGTITIYSTILGERLFTDKAFGCPQFTHVNPGEAQPGNISNVCDK